MGALCVRGRYVPALDEISPDRFVKRLPDRNEALIVK